MPVFSLPGPFGIGTLGKEAFAFVDFLARAKQTYWQILPIGPTGYGDSPYQSFSAFAGNPYFIDFRVLHEQGYLTADEIPAEVPVGPVDYGVLYQQRPVVLQKAADRLLAAASAEYKDFCTAQSFWLDDYALFMAICAKLLAEDGQMIFITPRSFASGRYFQSFRNFLFQHVSIELIHLFNTRKDTFAKDEVLQELVIMRMIPSGNGGRITVSYSQGISDLDHPYQKVYAASEIVDVSSEEKVVYLPVDRRDEAILSLFRSWDGNMEKYGIKISTGPVVAFRAYDFIVNEPADDTVPLYWLHNVVKMLCDHPVQKKGKGQYIKVASETKAALLPSKNYVLLRRFSSKDDNSRLVAAPYFGNMAQHEFVGIENKLNYIYRPKGHLRRDEVMGITALLDSEMFDAWFRTFNGNINVSATELRMMPLPAIETIREIGRKIILRNNYSIDFINDLVLDYFKIQYK